MDTDARAAIENHIPAIGVRWGTEEELSNYCDYITENIADLHGQLGTYK